MTYGIKITKSRRRGLLKFDDGRELALSQKETEEFDQWIDFRSQQSEAGLIDVNSRATLSEGLRKMVIAYTLPMVLQRLVQVLEDMNVNETDEEARYVFYTKAIKMLAATLPRIEKDYKRYQNSLKISYLDRNPDILKGRNKQ